MSSRRTRTRVGVLSATLLAALLAPTSAWAGELDSNLQGDCTVEGVSTPPFSYGGYVIRGFAVMVSCRTGHTIEVEAVSQPAGQTTPTSHTTATRLCLAATSCIASTSWASAPVVGPVCSYNAGAAEWYGVGYAAVRYGGSLGGVICD